MSSFPGLNLLLATARTAEQGFCLLFVDVYKEVEVFLFFEIGFADTIVRKGF